MALVNRETNEPNRQQPLRLWPGVVIVSVQWLSRFVVPTVMPEAMPFAVVSGLVGGLAVILWWVFFSRARWIERLGAVFVMIAAMFGTSGCGPILGVERRCWSARDADPPGRSRLHIRCDRGLERA